MSTLYAYRFHSAVSQVVNIGYECRRRVRGLHGDKDMYYMRPFWIGHVVWRHLLIPNRHVCVRWTYRSSATHTTLISSSPNTWFRKPILVGRRTETRSFLNDFFAVLTFPNTVLLVYCSHNYTKPCDCVGREKTGTINNTPGVYCHKPLECRQMFTRFLVFGQERLAVF